MEKHKSWKNLQSPNSRPLLWTVCLGLALMISAPVMAHGTKVHKDPTPPPIAEDTLSDPGIVAGGPTSGLAAPSAHEEGAHGHDSEDDHGEAFEEGAHDHSAHEPNEVLLESGIGRFLVWIGKLHPAAVHFPIALLLGAALAELLSLRFNDRFFRDAARFSLWLGTIGALGAALLGWLYGGFHLVDEESVLTYHRWNGTGIAALALLALWLGERRVRAQPARSGAYRTALFVTALLVGLNGYWGGLMVYGAEQHQWPTKPSEHAH